MIPSMPPGRRTSAIRCRPACSSTWCSAGLVPIIRNAKVPNARVSWNYTTYLNIVFLALAAVLVWRFFATGNRPMLKMMGGDPDHTHT